MQKGSKTCKKASKTGMWQAQNNRQFVSQDINHWKRKKGENGRRGVEKYYENQNTKKAQENVTKIKRCTKVENLFARPRRAYPSNLAHPGGARRVEPCWTPCNKSPAAIAIAVGETGRGLAKTGTQGKAHKKNPSAHRHWWAPWSKMGRGKEGKPRNPAQNSPTIAALPQNHPEHSRENMRNKNTKESDKKG